MIVENYSIRNQKPAESQFNYAKLPVRLWKEIIQPPWDF